MPPGGATFNETIPPLAKGAARSDTVRSAGFRLLCNP